MTRTITGPAAPTRRTTLARPQELIRRRLRVPRKPPLCLACRRVWPAAVSGPVRLTPSPGSPMGPPRCVQILQNNKHPCNPKPVCRSISSAFLLRAAGGRIQKLERNVICLSYVSLRYMFSRCYTCHMSGIYIPGVCHFWEHAVYLTYHVTDDIQCHMTGICLVYIRYTS